MPSHDPFDFIRPLGAIAGLHTPTYPSDDEVAGAIVAWCRGIRLGGSSHRLSVDRTNIVQLATSRLNATCFAVALNEPDQLYDILSKVPANAWQCESNAKGMEISGGVLFIRKHVEVESRTSWKIADQYWLWIFDKQLVPQFEVTSHAVLCPIVRESVLENSERYMASFPRLLQRPEDIVVDWHELAALLGLNRTRIYLEAVLESSHVRRSVFADAPDGRVVWSRFSRPRYSDADLASPEHVFPAEEYEEYFRSLYIANLVAIVDSQQIVTAPDLPVVPQHGIIPIQWQVDEYTLRRDTEPERTFGAACIRLLQQAAPGVPYIGRGLFLLTDRQLAVLAASVGTFGSPQAVSVTVATGAGAAVGGALGAGVAVAALWKSVRRDKFKKDREGCRRKSQSECRRCMMGTEEASVNVSQGIAGATGGGLLGAAALASPVPPIAIILAALAAIMIAAAVLDSASTIKEMTAECERQ